MRICVLLGLLLPAAPLLAQIGGISAYEFLNLPNSATVSALGGHHIAVQDDDLSLAARNPSLLNPSHNGALQLSHAFLPAGINNSFLAYARHREDLRTTFSAGLQYVGYGNDLVRRDPTGQDLGTFSAADYSVTVGAARSIEERLTVGLNVKVIASQLAGYGSLGMGMDAAVHYRDTSGRFGITLLARNFGRQLTHYAADGRREPMPFELQAGLSRELKYLPFRFSVVYRYLDRWNVLYDDPEAADDFQLLSPDGEETGVRGPGALFFDNLARHFVFSGELLIGKQRNLRLRAGYNHGLRRELRLSEFRSAAGYSFGFAWNTRRFRLAYGRGTYHLGGGVNQITLGTVIR
ncbi:type IX secretion system protein PorQ [Neolewinella litorea]|uniref:Type IX secretion system protein PorQ n=1 Tax=Neolewinella litorea TaxID=2562452 RepID=A0A4S4NPQ4_9BACT|nr:type IX secretion system protein PorQ [Neolewinella litorea]THH40391.1 type IX secretion system protein PorQ [Neolewinella litorea]